MKNLLLSKDKLFICYATVLQEWYRNPQATTSVSIAIESWLNDFCAALEIDTNAHSKFLNDARHNMEQMFWEAVLKDVAILPDTQSFEAIKLGMKLPAMRPGVVEPEKKS
jgi:hypothetical protein